MIPTTTVGLFLGKVCANITSITNQQVRYTVICPGRYSVLKSPLGDKNDHKLYCHSPPAIHVLKVIVSEDRVVYLYLG